MKCNANTNKSIQPLQPSNILSTKIINKLGDSDDSWDAEVQTASEVVKVTVQSLSSLFKRQAAAVSSKRKDGQPLSGDGPPAVAECHPQSGMLDAA